MNMLESGEVSPKGTFLSKGSPANLNTLEGGEVSPKDSPVN